MFIIQTYDENIAKKKNIGGWGVDQAIIWKLTSARGFFNVSDISMVLLVCDAGYVPSVWLSRCVDLPSEQSMRLAFEGRLFAYDTLYLDNVTVANQPCEGNCQDNFWIKY